jgi:hypothetical protein
MSQAFAALLPVFLLIVAGLVLRRTLVPEETHWLGVERLAYFVMFPALIVDTLARVDLSEVPVAGVGATLVGAILAMTVVCLLLREPLARRLDVNGAAFTSIFQGATRWNGYVALAIAAGLFGRVGIALVSVAMAVIIPLLNVLNVYVLARYAADGALDWRNVVRALLRNPFIWSCAVGIALNLLRLPLPAPVQAVADALGRSSLALGLLLVGAGLDPGGVLRPQPASIVATALRLVLMPAMAIGLGVLLGLSGPSLAVVAIVASVPSASSAYVLARQMGGDAPLVAQILTLQTVVAVVTVPAAIALAALAS